jgi:hypothetical protein
MPVIEMVPILFSHRREPRKGDYGSIPRLKRFLKWRIQTGALAVIAAFGFPLTKSTASGISEAFLARSKQLATNPVRSEIIEFGKFLIDQEEALTSAERERGDRTLAFALREYPQEEVASLLGELKGIRSACLAQLAIKFMEAGVNVDEANAFLRSTPDGVVDYFLWSIDSTRNQEHFLFELDDPALVSLLAELNAAVHDEQKVRILGLLSGTIRERGEHLSSGLVQKVINTSRDKLSTIADKRSREIAEACAERMESNR